MLNQDPRFGDQQKSSQKISPKKGESCLIGILKSSQKDVVRFHPWEFSLGLQGLVSRFPTHPRQRSKWSSQEFALWNSPKMISTGPKKWLLFFKQTKTTWKAFVTMFICLNQAKKTSKQSPINMNPNDQAKYSTHTLNYQLDVYNIHIIP